MNALFSRRKSPEPREETEEFIKIDEQEKLQRAWKSYTTILSKKALAIFSLLSQSPQEGLPKGITPIHLQIFKENLSDFQKAYELIDSVSTDSISTDSISTDDVLAFLKVKPKQIEQFVQFSDFLSNFKYTEKVEEYRKNLAEWLQFHKLTSKHVQENHWYKEGIREMIKSLLKNKKLKR